MFENTVTWVLYWNVGIFVNALLFLKQDENDSTDVLYLNNSLGTLTNDKQAENVELNDTADVQLSNNPVGTEVTGVNENVSVNSVANVE